MFHEFSGIKLFFGGLECLVGPGMLIYGYIMGFHHPSVPSQRGSTRRIRNGKAEDNKALKRPTPIKSHALRKLVLFKETFLITYNSSLVNKCPFIKGKNLIKKTIFNDNRCLKDFVHN